MRKRVYRKRVLEGRMTQEEALREIKTMEEVRHTLWNVKQPQLTP